MTREEKRLILTHALADNGSGIWCPDGWINLAYATHKALLAVEPTYRIIEIKEKFGQMRYIMRPLTPSTIDIIQAAEDKSITICQNCGSNTATSVDAGWVATLCDPCTRTPHHIPRGYTYTTPE